MSKPKVLYVPTEGHTKRVFRDETFARLLAEFEVTVNDTGAELDPDEVARIRRIYRENACVVRIEQLVVEFRASSFINARCSCALALAARKAA